MNNYLEEIYNKDVVKPFEEFIKRQVNEEENSKINYQIGKTYILDGKQVEYLGTMKDNPDIKPNATIGDYLLDKWALLFQWKEGDNSISSHGIKGDIIALGPKFANKRIKENG